MSKTTLYFAVISIFAFSGLNMVSFAYADNAPSATPASALGTPAPAATPASSLGAIAPAAVAASSLGNSAPASVPASTLGTPAPVAVPASSLGNAAPAAAPASSLGNPAPAAVPASSLGNTAPATTPASSLGGSGTGGNSGGTGGNTGGTTGGNTGGTGGGTSGGISGGNSSGALNQSASLSGGRRYSQARAILATAQCGKYINGPIKIGSSANNVDDVKKLQSFLIITQNADIEITGIYNPETIAAVRSFQSKYASDVLAPWGISAPTGDIVVTTNGKINAIICKRIYELTGEDKATIVAINSSLRGNRFASLAVKSRPAPKTQLAITTVPVATSTPININNNVAQETTTTTQPTVATAPSESNAASIFLAIPRAIGRFFKWLFYR